MLDAIDLSGIQDEKTRQLVGRLLSLIETPSTDLRDARGENQRLRDEVNRLKGEQGKPKILEWQHTDQTGTRVDGQEQHCNIVCNPVYTIYTTTAQKGRLSVLDVLRNGRPRRFRPNEKALSYLEATALGNGIRQWLRSECSEQDWDERTFAERLDRRWPTLGLHQRQAILNAAAVAACHAEEGHRAVRLLLCDAAPQYNGLTEEMSQCWVHEGRHHTKSHAHQKGSVSETWRNCRQAPRRFRLRIGYCGT